MDGWEDVEWRDIPGDARELYRVIEILNDVVLQLRTVDHPAAKNVDAIMRRIAHEACLLSDELKSIRRTVHPPPEEP